MVSKTPRAVAAQIIADYGHDLEGLMSGAITAALANAEREGMRRERERCANLINIIVNVFKRCEVENQWTGLLETLRNFVANPDQPGKSSHSEVLEEQAA